MSKMDVAVERTTGVKCPRCYRYTNEGHFNFESLCDRCCTILLKGFPEWSDNDEVIAGIKKFARKFLDMTPAERVVANEQIQLGEWPNTPEGQKYMGLA